MESKCHVVGCTEQQPHAHSGIEPPPAGRDAPTITGRFICTKDDPYTREKAAPFGGRVAHPDAVFIESDSDFYDGHDYDRYRCPNCGKSFTEQVPR